MKYVAFQQKMPHLTRRKISHGVCFKICSPARFKIIVTLKGSKKGLMVSELAKMFKYSLSRMSHQLAILRKYRVVTVGKRGRKKVYRISQSRVRKYLPCWR